MQARTLIGILLILTMLASSTSFAQDSGGVEIKKFETVKVIYKPGETVVFDIELVSNSQSERTYDVQVWVESELDPAVMVASQKGILRGGGKTQKLQLEWISHDKNVFGHRALLRIVNRQKRVLAEEETFFDITKEWWHVMRLACRGANALATTNTSIGRIRSTIRSMRRAYYNTFEIFKYAPEPYELAPEEDQWLSQMAKGRDQMVSKKVLQIWSKELHKNGMPYLAYNETSAAKGPDEWKIYFPWLDGGKTPYAPYYEEKGLFCPNSLKIADKFATQLEGAVKMFGFDGILMDSAFYCHRNTARGNDINGKKLTKLNAGEVAYIHVDKARKKARKIDPDFAFLSQNANILFRLLLPDKTFVPTDKIYAEVKAFVKKFNALHYSKQIEMWTLENDPINRPRDGRYPMTYERMSLVLNSIIEATGKPLMSWAFIIRGSKAIASTRPYMAMLLASRIKVTDHVGFERGALSQHRDSPASQQFIKYHRFMARFSYFLWDPKLRWETEPKKLFDVSASRPLFWSKTVYKRKLGAGKTKYVINILNLPSNPNIVGQKEIPPVAKNVELKILKNLRIGRVVFIDADNDDLKPIDLERSDGNVYKVPPVTCWALIVIDPPGKKIGSIGKKDKKSSTAQPQNKPDKDAWMAPYLIGFDELSKEKVMKSVNAFDALDEKAKEGELNKAISLLQNLTIKAVEAGNDVYVYVKENKKRSKAKIIKADEEGVTVRFSDTNIRPSERRISWEDLGDEALLGCAMWCIEPKDVKGTAALLKVYKLVKLGR